MKEIKHIALSILIIIVLGLGIKLFTYSEDPAEAVKNNYLLSYKKEYKIYSPPLPTQLNFCSEGVPLDTFYVSEQLDREILVNTYWHSNTLLLLKRANRWFPIIEPILKEYGIPDDFKYLALVESNLQNVKSPAGAIGYWQLMKRTAQLYGLQVNREIDERYNVKKSTIAACKYINDAYKQFGSWTLAAASYNMGRGGLNKRMKQQGVSNYYDLVLNEETSRYMFRTIAMKTIFTNPSKYGFTLREVDLYPLLKYSIVEIDKPIPSWVSFARENGISFRLLKEFNPWIRSFSLTNASHKKYEIMIPDESMYQYQSMRAGLSSETGVFGENRNE
jgi:hypothetical protein